MNVTRPATVAVAVLVVASIGTVALAGPPTPGASALGTPATDDPSTTIDHEGDTLTLRTAPNQTITGSTTLEQGTELRVTVRSTGGSPFLMTATTSVDGDGRFSVTMDFSNLDAGDAEPAVVSVYADGDELANASVTFEPGPGDDPSADEETTADGSGPDATVDHEGDTLTLETETGRTIAGSSTLDPGTTVTVMLRGSGEEPFLKNFETTTGEDGTFSVTVDLADLDAEKAEPAVLMVRADGETLTQLDVTFEPGPGPEPDEEYTTADRDGAASEASLETGVVHVRGGETAAIPVSVGEDGRATLVVGGDGTDYEARFRLVDGDGDGRVTLLLDTGRVDPDERRVDAESDADSIGVPVEADSTAAALAPGDYPLALYPGVSTDAGESDLGTLNVVDPDADSDDSSSDDTGDDDTPDDTGGDGSENLDDEPARSPADDGLPADPSVLGLTAIAVVALGIAGTITFLRR